MEAARHELGKCDLDMSPGLLSFDSHNPPTKVESVLPTVLMHNGFSIRDVLTENQESVASQRMSSSSSESLCICMTMHITHFCTMRGKLN